jgi:hypothetical protein
MVFLDLTACRLIGRCQPGTPYLRGYDSAGPKLQTMQHHMPEGHTNIHCENPKSRIFPM